jgi:hypothetical protein
MESVAEARQKETAAGSFNLNEVKRLSFTVFSLNLRYCKFVQGILRSSTSKIM